MARAKDDPLIPTQASCHSLRHSKAIHLLQAGVNLVYIWDILGYVSVTTPEIYARADSKQKRDAIEKAYAPPKKKRLYGLIIEICLIGLKDYNINRANLYEV